MKRRSFVSKGIAGLSFLAAGVAKPLAALRGRDGRRRVYGIPDSVKPRTPLAQDRVRFSIARTDLPPVPPGAGDPRSGLPEDGATGL